MNNKAMQMALALIASTMFAAPALAEQCTEQLADAGGQQKIVFTPQYQAEVEQTVQADDTRLDDHLSRKEYRALIKKERHERRLQHKALEAQRNREAGQWQTNLTESANDAAQRAWINASTLPSQLGFHF